MHQKDKNEEGDDDEKENHQPINFSFNVWSQFLANFIEEIYQAQNDIVWYSASNQDYQDKEQSIDYTNKLILFGKNSYDENIWKVKYFIHDEIQAFYRNHYIQHAAHILRQPAYYKGLFEILN